MGEAFAGKVEYLVATTPCVLMVAGQQQWQQQQQLVGVGLDNSASCRYQTVGILTFHSCSCSNSSSFITTALLEVFAVVSVWHMGNWLTDLILLFAFYAQFLDFKIEPTCSIWIRSVTSDCGVSRGIHRPHCTCSTLRVGTQRASPHAVLNILTHAPLLNLCEDFSAIKVYTQEWNCFCQRSQVWLLHLTKYCQAVLLSSCTSHPPRSFHKCHFVTMSPTLRKIKSVNCVVQEGMNYNQLLLKQLKPCLR